MRVLWCGIVGRYTGPYGPPADPAMLKGGGVEVWNAAVGLS